MPKYSKAVVDAAMAALDPLPRDPVVTHWEKAESAKEASKAASKAAAKEAKKAWNKEKFEMEYGKEGEGVDVEVVGRVDRHGEPMIEDGSTVYPKEYYEFSHKTVKSREVATAVSRNKIFVSKPFVPKEKGEKDPQWVTARDESFEKLRAVLEKYKYNAVFGKKLDVDSATAIINLYGPDRKQWPKVIRNYDKKVTSTKMPRMPKDVRHRLEEEYRRQQVEEEDSEAFTRASDEEDDSEDDKTKAAVPMKKSPGKSPKKAGVSMAKKAAAPTKEAAAAPPKGVMKEEGKADQPKKAAKIGYTPSSNIGHFSLFCGDCTQPCGSCEARHRFECIGSIRIFQANLVELQTLGLCQDVKWRKKGTLPFAKVVCTELFKIFPHNDQCQVPKEDQRGSMYDREQLHGSGFHISTFPNEEIFGDTFDEVVEAMGEWKVGDPLPPGWPIKIGDTTNNVGPYRKEERRYVVMPNPVPWWQHLVSARKVREVGLRLFLYLPNYTNAAEEWVTWMRGNSYPEREDVEPDKFLKNLYIVFGGIPFLPEGATWADAKAGKVNIKIVHQPMHCDVGKHRGQYTVSDNPALKGKSKPGSLNFALEDNHKIQVLVGGDEKTQTFLPGEMFYIVGDGVHAGTTRTLDDLGTHASLHTMIGSFLHDSSGRKIDLDFKYCSDDNSNDDGDERKQSAKTAKAKTKKARYKHDSSDDSSDKNYDERKQPTLTGKAKKVRYDSDESNNDNYQECNAEEKEDTGNSDANNNDVPQSLASVHSSDKIQVDLTPANIKKYIILSHHPDFLELQPACFKFIRKNAGALLMNPNFLSLAADNIGVWQNVMEVVLSPRSNGSIGAATGETTNNDGAHRSHKRRHS